MTEYEQKVVGLLTIIQKQVQAMGVDIKLLKEADQKRMQSHQDLVDRTRGGPGSKL